MEASGISDLDIAHAVPLWRPASLAALPSTRCGRRVAILYGGAFFACRHCHQLSYESQRERDFERALHRAQAIQERLGGSGYVDDWFPQKPKGMHCSTFSRLARRYLDDV
jgi:hypothetical protein